MMNRTQFVWTKTGLSLAILVLCVGVVLPGAATNAEDVSYSPKVGDIFHYGVEYRIVERTEGNRQPLMVRQRCRLRIQVLSAASDGWVGKYDTLPFGSGGPIKNKQQVERRLETAEAEFKDPASSLGPAMPAGDPTFAQMRNESRQRMMAAAKEKARRTLLELNAYAGLYRHCSGELHCSRLGEIKFRGDVGPLPFATGTIAALIFLELPSNGMTESGFSTRTNGSLTVRSASSDQEAKSDLSILSLQQPRESIKPGHLAFDREVEIAGGVTAGSQLTLSGSGMWEFSPKMGMPYAGSVDYEIEGSSYYGIADKFDLRVGFHYLDPVRMRLFDAGLLPTPEALDEENLPRLTVQQQREMVKQWEPKTKSRSRLSRNRNLENQLRVIALNSAPPPENSRLERMMKDMLADDASWTDTIDFQRILDRWKNIRKIATGFPRTWSDPSGEFKIRAILQTVDGDGVSLRRLDNDQVIKVPLEKLSEKDVEFAKTFGVAKRIE
ncbi:SHD1 domain-containing protein [Rhodopirellula halodulae]|uniref:SHD1 domain-containing protein n=1 Tax=Rhodopirellula halodulae TaxID=2894198 RepID=UPI001E4769BF|nr:SHD1 domain-containing protein [Rhodopirellula sp. JC737]MCC9657703.1 hypothetical protein [Rhodopirellula sp. JC737]